MPNIVGTSWGATPWLAGDAGGVVTWSIAGAGENITAFPTAGTSVDPDGFLTIDYVGLISDAFAEWSAQGNIEFMHVADPGGSAGGTADVDIRIFFGALSPYDGYAYFPSDPVSAIAGDILLDNLYSYNFNTGYFYGLALHEIGHALGLDHVTGARIMNPSILVQSLSADDISGITTVYGVQDGAATVYNMPTGKADLMIYAAPHQVTINGNRQDNVITATADAETINGAEGDDTLIGGGGADALDGGAGADVASYANATEKVKVDLMFGHANRGDALGDTHLRIEGLIGSAFDDALTGDSARNQISGLQGVDFMRGRAGRDTLLGGQGDDSLNGGKGRDRLEGEAGDDTLDGLGGLDNLRGGKGNDKLDGGLGNDLLTGGKGRDTLDGGRDDDELTGSSEADTFVFADGHGNDTITDFDALDDAEVIDLSAVTSIAALHDLTGPGGAASQQGADVLIDTGGGNSILLLGVTLGDLGQNDFDF